MPKPPRRRRPRHWRPPAHYHHCVDCGLDVTTAGQWYMGDVWAASGLGPEDGVLCLPDLERRLARPLVYEDFKPTTDTQ